MTREIGLARLRRFCRVTASTLFGLLVGIATIILTAPAATAAERDEVWALDQGTNMVHIYDAALKEVDRIDLGAQGVRVPHMIDFTSDHAYAFIASTASGDVTVIRTQDRKVLDIIKTGPRTHMAVVKPDDSAVIADVIGSTDKKRDGKLVEITIDRASETFKMGRSLVVSEDPVFKAAADRFGDAAPICHEYSTDGRLAFVTLGPGIKDGGLVVLDTEKFALVKAFPPDELKVNCGTVRTPDGKRMLVNGGDHDLGVWYALDIATQTVVKEGSSGGHDAHGTWPTPDGKEIWMVNRVSKNGIVLDANSLEVVGKIENLGGTPDIIAISPDSRRAFVSLRGPNPKSMPHVAKGDTPGFAVLDIKTRKLETVIQPAAGNPDSDFHGIGVRVIGN